MDVALNTVVDSNPLERKEKGSNTVIEESNKCRQEIFEAK